MLKYLDFQRSCDLTFALFLISWAYTRHYLYCRIIWSSIFDSGAIFHRDNKDNPTYQLTPPSGGGAWEPGYDWNPGEGYYMTPQVHVAFLALLAVLQGILLLWFVMIVQLAIRVIRGSHAEDDRSDDEGDGDGSKEEESEGDDEWEENGVPVDVDSGHVANGNTSIPILTAANGIDLNGIHKRK
jgi:very-long-chain ceramide synthase